MNLALTGDQVQLRDHMRTFFERESSFEAVREAEPLGFDADLWADAASVGIPGMCLPDAVGGGGSGLLDAALVVEEAGRCVAAIPVVEHVVAGRALARLLDDGSSWLARMATGDARGTLALAPARAGAWRLVPAGAVADVVVGAANGNTVAVAAEPPMASPVNHASSPIADRPVAGERIAVVDGGDDVLLAARDDWKTLTAASLVGVAAKALEIGVDYVRTRHQFGRPIGSFQAVQHGLADLVGIIDGGRLLVGRAAWACDHEDPATRGRLASMAFLFAGEAAKVATARSLHFHGGYGVMREYDIQLLYRRARGWVIVAGDPEHEYLDLADRLFGPAQN